MKKQILLLIIILVCLFALAVAIYILAPKYQKAPMTIVGNSMEPTLQDGQEVLVNLDYYKTHQVKRNDIVAFKFITVEDPMVKRIIALPGDKLEFKDGAIYVNSKKIEEDYLKDEDYQLSQEELKVLLVPLKANDNRVPNSSYFCLSDNRIEKTDSRKWGFLPADYVIGRVEI